MVIDTSIICVYIILERRYYIPQNFFYVLIPLLMKQTFFNIRNILLDSRPPSHSNTY